MKDEAFPRFDLKRAPYERWWANTTVLIDRRVPQFERGSAETKHRYRIEVFVEYMDGERLYRNQVDSWDTDLTTKKAALAAVPNYILLTQMKDPDPWNLKESKS